jgi:hypothetical protein
MYVEGGFMNNMGLAGVVFPNSAMWSLQVKVAVDKTISKGGLKLFHVLLCDIFVRYFGMISQ